MTEEEEKLLSFSKSSFSQTDQQGTVAQVREQPGGWKDKTQASQWADGN